MRYNLSITYFSLIFLIGCGTNNNQTDFSDSLTDFYYPLSNEKIVYKYETIRSDTISFVYDIFWTEFELDTVVVQELYSSDHELKYTFKYQVNKEGAFFKQYISHKKDPHKDIPFKILHDKVILWNDKTSPYRIAFDNTYFVFHRQRQFKGYGNTYNFQGDSIKTIRFTDNMWKDIDGIKGDIQERNSEYAEGIGPFSEYWKANNGKEWRSKLVEIMKYDDWILNKNGA